MGARRIRPIEANPSARGLERRKVRVPPGRKVSNHRRDAHAPLCACRAARAFEMVLDFVSSSGIAPSGPGSAVNGSSQKTPKNC